MSISSAIALFLGCLVLAIISSAVLSHLLDQVGTHLGLSGGLLGLVTALGADSPEIATAVTALAGGQHDMGSGVIFGSNIFNIAALLGLIMLPYIAVSAMKPSQFRQPFIPGPATRWLQAAVHDAQVDSGDERFPIPPSWADSLAIIPLLAMVVVSSIGMVRAATVLGPAFGVSDAVLGTLVLATLTGIPNAVAAVRLALQGRGAAVVSETFNSNSLNLIAGAYLPTLFVTASPLSGSGRFALWRLLGGTLLATILFLPRAVLTRRECGVLIAGYAGFAWLVAAG